MSPLIRQIRRWTWSSGAPVREAVLLYTAHAPQKQSYSSSPSRSPIPRSLSFR